MKFTTQITGGAAAATLGLVLGSLAPHGATALGATAAQAELAPHHTERDVVSFLVLGTGPLMKTHPALAESLGIVPQKVSVDEVDRVVDLIAEVDPQFGERVAEPVQSGDPVRAQAGLEALADDIAAVSRLTGTAKSAAIVDGTARGITVTEACLLITGMDISLGTQIAASVVMYRPDTGATAFDRELAARSLAVAL